MVFKGQWISGGSGFHMKKLSKAEMADDVVVHEVLGNVMHDLKTPLTAIGGYAQGILDGVADTPERLAKYAITIRNKAEDMTNLVDDIFFLTQIYQKNLEYHFQKVNVDEYLSRCLSEMSLDMELKKISLMYQCLAGDDIFLMIDPDRLKRVLYNIIDNSAKYIRTDVGVVYVKIEESIREEGVSENGKIGKGKRGKGESVKSESTNGKSTKSKIGKGKEYVTVSISDNGEGIDESDLERIFERFYRTDRSRSSSTGGSGIGLSIAKKIMEDHGGRIWAESELGTGTTIFLEFPKVLEEK